MIMTVNLVVMVTVRLRLRVIFVPGMAVPVRVRFSLVGVRMRVVHVIYTTMRLRAWNGPAITVRKNDPSDHTQDDRQTLHSTHCIGSVVRSNDFLGLWYRCYANDTAHGAENASLRAYRNGFVILCSRLTLSAKDLARGTTPTWRSILRAV